MRNSVIGILLIAIGLMTIAAGVLYFIVKDSKTKEAESITMTVITYSKDYTHEKVYHNAIRKNDRTYYIIYDSLLSGILGEDSVEISFEQEVKTTK